MVGMLCIPFIIRPHRRPTTERLNDLCLCRDLRVGVQAKDLPEKVQICRVFIWKLLILYWWILCIYIYTILFLLQIYIYILYTIYIICIYIYTIYIICIYIYYIYNMYIYTIYIICIYIYYIHIICIYIYYIYTIYIYTIYIYYIYIYYIYIIYIHSRYFYEAMFKNRQVLRSKLSHTGLV